MLKNLMNKKSKSKGFTLIELIIVIAIIAILAAVAVPKYLEVREKSNVKTDVSSAKVIYDTTVSLIADNKITPGVDLTAKTEVNNTSSDASVSLIVKNIDMTNAKLKNKTNKDKNFQVIVLNNGDVQVWDNPTSGTAQQVYPDTGVNGNKYSNKYSGDYLS